MSATSCARPLPSLLSSLSIRTTGLKRPSTSGQIRTQATSRRTTKRLRATPLPSAPQPHAGATTHTSPLHSPSPFSRPTNPSATTITFTPPPSSPTPYHTPAIFLPPNDPRRVTLAAAHAVASPYAASNGTRRLPPAVRKPYEKTYHLGKEQIEEMRRLRLEDPEKWTRHALAEKYGCTEFFVGIAAPSTQKRRDWHRETMARASESWGPKRTKARAERVKRRELWAKDA